MVKVHFLVLWLMLHPLVNNVSCAFPFENELRGITELRPLKRWLVFMEIRLWRCTRLASPARLSVYNLLDLLHCTHIHKPQKRCYHIIRYHHYIAIYGNSFRLIAPPSLKKHDIANFYSKEKTYRQPVNGNCEGFFLKFSLSYNNCINIYCGKQYPWSTYIRSHRIEIGLTHAKNHKSADIGMLVGLIDRHISSQCATNSGRLIQWGDFKVHAYQHPYWNVAPTLYLSGIQFIKKAKYIPIQWSFIFNAPFGCI